VKRILAGTDGSAMAGDALQWASNLARSHGAELLVITCRRPLRPRPGAEEAERLEAEFEAELASWADPVRHESLAVRTLLIWDDPREAILRVAADEAADLIVVGRAGRGCEAGPGVLQLNSTAEYLAHHTDRPLAVIGHDGPQEIRRLLVGVDGSDNARAAVRWVADTASRTGASVVVASVWQPILEWSRSDSPRNWRRDLEANIREEWAPELFDGGLDVEIHALRGSRPADCVLRLATRTHADTVVMGMRGLGGFSGLRVGGVALRTLHRARRPVVLVPPASR
jgi:nucleotide-binding universal stress UspA family protein